MNYLIDFRHDYLIGFADCRVWGWDLARKKVTTDLVPVSVRQLLSKLNAIAIQNAHSLNQMAHACILHMLANGKGNLPVWDFLGRNSTKKLRRETPWISIDSPLCL